MIQLTNRYLLLSGFDNRLYLLNVATKSLRACHDLQDFCTGMEIIRSSKKGTLLVLIGYQSGKVELFVYQKPAELNHLKKDSVVKSMGTFLKKNTHPISSILFGYGSKFIYAITQEGDLFVHKLIKKVDQ